LTAYPNCASGKLKNLHNIERLIGESNKLLPVGPFMPTIRETLNRIKWASPSGLSDCEIVIVHRGVPGDLKTIKGSTIKDVAPRAMLIEEKGEEIVIPYHRIRVIRKGSMVVWEKKSRGV